MDSRFYNSSGCLSSSSNSSPDENKKRGRAITGAHHFTSPETIRRPLFPDSKESSLVPSAPQTLFWGQMDRNQFEPVVPIPMQNTNTLVIRFLSSYHNAKYLSMIIYLRLGF